MERYLEQAAYLHSGKMAETKPSDNLSIKTLCNLYLDYQKSRVTIGEIKPRQVYDQTRLLRHFARYIGPNRVVSDISTIDLQNYRNKLIKSGKAPNTINNHISAIKAMYHWAMDNELIDYAPNLKAIKKISASKTEKPVFSATQLAKLFSEADTQMKAMILLGLNCGFGCTDCAQLKWESLDLKRARVSFPRGKTGIPRNLPLVKEGIEIK